MPSPAISALKAPVPDLPVKARVQCAGYLTAGGTAAPHCNNRRVYKQPTRHGVVDRIDQAF